MGGGDVGIDWSQIGPRYQAYQQDRAARRMEGAKAALDLARSTPGADEASLQAAAREYEAAGRDYYGQNFTFPTKTTPATTGQPEVQAQPAFPGAPARGQGVGLPPEAAVQGQPAVPAAPAKTSYDVAPSGGGSEQILELRSRFESRIAAATTPVERASAVKTANDWRAATIARYPQYAALIPDYADLGKKFETEQAAQITAKGKVAWAEAMRTSKVQVYEARNRHDLPSLIQAINEHNRLIETGKEAGYEVGEPLDPERALKLWAMNLPPDVANRMEGELNQIGIQLTPKQKKEIELYLGQKEKVATPKVTDLTGGPIPTDIGRLIAERNALRTELLVNPANAKQQNRLKAIEEAIAKRPKEVLPVLSTQRDAILAKLKTAIKQDQPRLQKRLADTEAEMKALGWPGAAPAPAPAGGPAPAPNAGLTYGGTSELNPAAPAQTGGKQPVADATHKQNPKDGTWWHYDGKQWVAGYE